MHGFLRAQPVLGWPEQTKWARAMDWVIYDYYLFAAAALLGTFAAAAVLIRILCHPKISPRIQPYQGVVPPFINILGVLFGLTLAFLANDTWNAQDRALAAVEREADAARSMIILSSGLPPEQASRIRQSALRYAQAALDEWPKLALRNSDPAAEQAADALLRDAATPAQGAAASPPVMAAQTELALSIRQARESRLALSQTHVNPLKWLVMAFLGFLTMVSIAVVHIGSPKTMRLAVALFALASGPTAVIVLIHGNPFQPPAAVMPTPLAKMIAAQMP